MNLIIDKKKHLNQLCEILISKIKFIDTKHVICNSSLDIYKRTIDIF